MTEVTRCRPSVSTLLVTRPEKTRPATQYPNTLNPKTLKPRKGGGARD